MKQAGTSILVLSMSSILPLAASITVTLSPEPAGPQPVGTSIVWTATAVDSDPGSHDYRFTAQKAGQPVRILRDFGGGAVWTWTHSEFEGTFTVGVVARNRSTRDTATASASYVLTSRLAGGLAAVNPTRNPLVALFSAPACLVPNLMRVRFRQSSDPMGHNTNLVPCRAQAGTPSPDLTSMNFYVAGMYPSTTYQMRWEVVQPNMTPVANGVELPFITGIIPSTVLIRTPTVRAPPQASTFQQPVLLANYLDRLDPPAAVNAMDLLGRTLWYYDTPGASIDRTNPGGTMLYRMSAPVATDSVIREIDLAGNVLLETSVRRVSEQLVARGFRRILTFNHEVRRIHNPGKPNDSYIIVIGGTDMVSTSQQGGTPANPVDILGDEIIVLDTNLQVSWAWNPFLHLDVDRKAVLNERCTASTVCKPFTIGFTSANDWMHMNTVQHTPWDGNLIASLRSQDWVIKVNYADGAGDGSLVWRMGPGGDFSITTATTESSPDIGFPWFSHQHDSEFERGGAVFGGRRVMTVYDNGNTRRKQFNSAAHSRCQSYAVDEANRTVNLNVNADVGLYSEAFGSAQLLLNGEFSCTSGQSSPAVVTENDRSGVLTYIIAWPTLTYRSLRMRDLYSPATP